MGRFVGPPQRSCPRGIPKDAEGTAGKWEATAGKWFSDEAEDTGIQTAQDSRFFGISAGFDWDAPGGSLGGASRSLAEPRGSLRTHADPRGSLRTLAEPRRASRILAEPHGTCGMWAGHGVHLIFVWRTVLLGFGAMRA